jgi:hypothetical protein
MSNWSCEINVAQSLSTNLGLNNLNPTFLTNDTTVLHALVLTAVTLVILHRAKNLGAEEAVTLRLKCPVIDGLRFLHFPV